MTKDEFIKWSMENIDHEVLLEAVLEMCPDLLESYMKDHPLPYIFQPARGMQ